MQWLLSPLSWLLLASLLGVLAWRLRLRWLIAGCVAWALLAVAGMTPLVANALTEYLERPAPLPAHCRAAPPATVVVLSGSVERLPEHATDFAAMNLASRRRVERGVQYWRKREQRDVVLAGGEIAAGSMAHAELMHGYARWLGVPEAALRIEPRSGNTRESARNLARLTPPLPRRVALVTSALHMPRARAAFAAVGFAVCPLPADFLTEPVSAPGYLVPRTSSLVKTELALHELVGLAWYRWQGWLARRNEPQPAS